MPNVSKEQITFFLSIIIKLKEKKNKWKEMYTILHQLLHVYTAERFQAVGLLQL